MKRKAPALGLLALAATCLAGTSVAWACSTIAPSAYVSADPTRAAAGAGITVSGHNMDRLDPRGDPADITVIWEDASQRQLQTLATLPGTDSFSVQVVVPSDAGSGDFNIGAIRNGGSANPAVFEVLNPTRAAGTGSGGPPPVDQSTYSNLGQDAAGPTGVTSGSTRNTSAGNQGGTRQPSGGSRGLPLGAGGPTGGGAAGGQQTAAGGPGPGSGAAGSLPSNPDNAAGQRPVGGGVPASSVLSDLWGGFAQGRTRSAAPGLIEAPDSMPTAALVGALIVAGLLALSAGFAVAELGRRRVTVRA